MPTLMVLGTTSDAGKSTLVTALGRIFARKGVRVAPFKPQNMALNSAVTADGGEIGRAQALQAQACFLEPHLDMNPVLIKPSSDTRAQIIVHGKAVHNMDAAKFHDYKSVAMGAVLQSFERLQHQYDFILVEGAGSPAEINLRDRDIANMGFAEAVDCPCILIADIDKGGVFAHIVGTLELLSESERNRIVGFVINRFRGDISLLQSGLDWLEQQTGKPVLAVLPYLHSFYLDAEDAIAIQPIKPCQNKLKIAVPVLPRISNHTDFDPLRLHPDIDFLFIDIAGPLPSCDLVILPGSKNVLADLAALKRQGWSEKLNRHLRYGGKIFGVCGGYQMLGEVVADPFGVEGVKGDASGFGFLPLSTALAEEKQLKCVSGHLIWQNTEIAFTGYEIHHGETYARGPLQPLLKIDGEGFDGYVSDDHLVAGCYCHGLFEMADVCRSLLLWCGVETHQGEDFDAYRERQIERLACEVDKAFDWETLAKAAPNFRGLCV